MSNCRHKPHSPHGYWALDLLGEIGDPVFPSGSGIVRIGGRFHGCATTQSQKAGVWVWVEHGGGYQTRYLHLDSLSVRDGQRVTPDTRIGTLGRSGSMTCNGNRDEGGYLHYEERSGPYMVHRLQVGTLHACHGDEAVSYPQALGERSWNAFPPYVKWLESSGNSCLPTDLT